MPGATSDSTLTSPDRTPDAPDAPGRRERKKQATRREIARAALRLAQQHGPEAVTVEAISEAADVSRRTVFNHFASKDDAILNIDPDRAAQVRARFTARPADESPMRSLRAVLVGASEELDSDLGDWRQRVQLVREHPGTLSPRYVAAFADTERALIEVVAERLGTDPDRDLRPRLVVAAAMAALRVATDTWEMSARAVRLEHLVDEAFTQLAEGFD